jgi:hypothetical protein
MSLNYPSPGPNYVPSYQVSGVPYVTGSGTGTESISTVKRFDFPYVTKFLTFSNNTSGEELFVAFSSEGMTGLPSDPGIKHIFTVPGLTIANLEVRCKSIFLKTSAAIQWSVCAGLTNIPSSTFPILTGSIGGTSAFEGIG